MTNTSTSTTQGWKWEFFKVLFRAKTDKINNVQGAIKKGKKVITYIMGLMVSSTTLYIDIVHDVEEKRLKIST